MNSEQFDRWTQALNTRISRRGLTGGLTAGSLAALGLAATADAKNKHKNKNKNKDKGKGKNSPPPPELPEANTTCQNLGTACGNTAVCQCRLDKASVQTCENVVVPPDGVSFANRPCISNANCDPGTVCDASASVCVTTCVN